VSNSYDDPKPLSFFSSHLFISNAITDWDFAQTPDKVGYFLRTDGTLACLLYNPIMGIMAWWEFKTRAGDVITSIAVQTGPTGDTLFLAVTRGAFNYVEQMTSPDWTDVRLSCYMDCATQKFNAIAYTTVAVNASFNGVTMGVVADGAYIGTAVPVGGVLTLPGGKNANYATVGLLPVTPTVKSLPISPEGKYGPGLTDLRNIDHVGLMLYNTLDCQVYIDGGIPQQVPELAALNVANPTPYTGQATPVAIQTSNQFQPIVDIQSASPLPCEVTALVPEVTL
jgi:hypothetical protein